MELLKDEYDRVDILNDRKVELKMRQVRLNKLFKDIERINKYHLRRNGCLDTKESMHKQSGRFDKLKKARNLGQFFSKRNLVIAERKIKKPLLCDNFELNDIKHESLTSKRFKYGNKISDRNLCKIRKYKQIQTKPNTSLINYNTDSNNQSISTMSYIVNNNKTKDDINLLMNGKTSVLTLTDNIHLINLEPVYKNTLKDSREIESNRARKLWSKLVTYISYTFGKRRTVMVSDRKKFINKPILSGKVTYLSEIDVNLKKVFESFSPMPSLIKKFTPKNVMEPSFRSEENHVNETITMNEHQFSVEKMCQHFENHYY